MLRFFFFFKSSFSGSASLLMLLLSRCYSHIPQARTCTRTHTNVFHSIFRQSQNRCATDRAAAGTEFKAVASAIYCFIIHWMLWSLKKKMYLPNTIEIKALSSCTAFCGVKPGITHLVIVETMIRFRLSPFLLPAKDLRQTGGQDRRPNLLNFRNKCCV